MKKESIKCVVSGSFKFKPEIDLAIEELQDHGVLVLAPEKGWLYMPPSRAMSLKDKQFRPLPSERGMSPAMVEDEFLRAMMKSDFVYVMAEDGYIGTMVAFELGAALALGLPIYSSREILWDSEMDPNWIAMIKVATVSEAIEEVNNLKFG